MKYYKGRSYIHSLNWYRFSEATPEPFRYILYGCHETGYIVQAAWADDGFMAFEFYCNDLNCEKNGESEYIESEDHRCNLVISPNDFWMYVPQIPEIPLEEERLKKDKKNWPS